jgi:succinate dehydrogenase / fumarate reductase iron-sulfur subunit
MSAKPSPKTVEIHIRRRANPDSPQYWEQFEIPYRPNLNIISCLMEIQKNPGDQSGERTTPPVWQMNCPRAGVWHLHDGD